MKLLNFSFKTKDIRYDSASRYTDILNVFRKYLRVEPETVFLIRVGKSSLPISS